MIEIIFSSFNQLFNAINIFLQQKDLTLGAILAGVSPFIVLWIKISNEKGKKAKQLMIERRQLQIAFNVNEILEALKVESKWSLQEIGSSHEVRPNLKNWFSYLPKLSIQKRRVFKMNLSGKKKILAVGVAILINGCNDVFALHLTPETIKVISGLGGGYVLLETVIDIVRAWANRTKEVVVVDAIPTINGSSDK